MEQWKTIEDTTNYEISNFGNVRNSITKQILKGRESKSGYYQVSLKKIQTQKFTNYYIHRLVAQYWIDNDSNKREVNHKDGNKLNNHMTNLEWMTSSENQLHRQHVLGKQKTSHRKIGRFDKNGELLEEYNSIVEAAKSFGKSRVNIDSALQKKQLTAYGYIWKYLD